MIRIKQLKLPVSHTEEELMSGDFVKVRVTQALEYDLIGEMIS